MHPPTVPGLTGRRDPIGSLLAKLAQRQIQRQGQADAGRGVRHAGNEGRSNAADFRVGGFAGSGMKTPT